MDSSTKTRILLVEDNLSTGQMYERILKESDFDVDYAMDGDEAWNYVSQGGYDLVLMDIKMPKMDGLTVLEKLRQNPPKIENGPIVMLTNMTEEALVKKAMSLGALSYMDKSNLNPNQLVQKIYGVLGMPDPSL